MSPINADDSVFARLTERFGRDVEAELRRAVGTSSLPLYHMVRYHLGWVDEFGGPIDADPGKRLRPLLCLFACEAVRGEHDAALPAAASVELVHNFTLVHDDVMDEDHERRHRRTVWSIWGSSQAINAGDLLYSMGVASMSRLHGRDVSASDAIAAVRRLEETCVRVIEGQYLDLEFEDSRKVSVDDYLAMIANKAAALISCSLELGALAGGADTNVQAAFAEIGMQMGLAFQIRDDILGVWGERELTGKPVGNDIRRKKKSLPVVLAFDCARGEALASLRRISATPDVSDEMVSETLNLMDDLRIRESAQALGDKHSAAAAASIARLAIDRGAKSDLIDFAVYLASRDS